MYFLKYATYIADRDYTIGEIDRRLFGSFVEHFDRIVYNGLLEPEHPLADEQGFRKDVIETVREAGISAVRYPGGNFVSGYSWTDGIGPVENRKRRLNLAWNMVETNRMGTDEFADWCRKADVGFMATVNLGTGTPREAGEMVEYCNHPGGTYWSDLRKSNGHPNPHNIRLWYLGNEMDGEWQIGQTTAEGYVQKALEAAKVMRYVDPTIELAACGSSCTETPTYPDWDRTVLESMYDKIDYISLHRYYSYDPRKRLFYPTVDDRTDIAHFPLDLEEFLHTVISAADYAKVKRHGRKNVDISFDEWNVVSNSNIAYKTVEPWQDEIGEGQEVFSMLDALVYGGLLCTFVKHADRVKIACQALLLNVGGMFFTQKGGGLVKSPAFYPFQQMASLGRGISMQDRVVCPQIVTNHYGEVPAVQTATVLNEEDKMLTVFAVNFGGEDIALSMDFRGFETVRPAGHSVLDGDPAAVNTFEEPEKIRPRQVQMDKTAGPDQNAVLPAMSWNVLRFSLSGRQ